jgi:hypothetical protein
LSIILAVLAVLLCQHCYFAYSCQSYKGNDNHKVVSVFLVHRLWLALIDIDAEETFADCFQLVFYLLE